MRLDLLAIALVLIALFTVEVSSEGLPHPLHYRFLYYTIVCISYYHMWFKSGNIPVETSTGLSHCSLFVSFFVRSVVSFLSIFLILCSHFPLVQ